MPPFVRMLVLGLVAAIIVGSLVYAYFWYSAKRAEMKHEREMSELEHQQQMDEELLTDDYIDRELEKGRE